MSISSQQQNNNFGLGFKVDVEKCGPLWKQWTVEGFRPFRVVSYAPGEERACVAALIALPPADGFTEVTAHPEQFVVPAVSTFTLRGSGGQKCAMIVWLKGSRMARDEFDVGLVMPALDVSVKVAKEMEELVAKFQSLEG